MDDLPHSLDRLSTPAFLADRRIVQRNCDRMREKAARSGVIFRPHVKTHKTIEVALMQHGGAKGPITVSTMAEAEFFADAGFDDITYAVPLAPDRIARASALAARIATFNVLIDSADALKAIERAYRSSRRVLDVFLKIDCGDHRAGVDPDNPQSVDLAKSMAKSSAIRFRGLLTHAGQSYKARWEREVRAIARQETEALTRFRDRVKLRSVASAQRRPRRWRSGSSRMRSAPATTSSTMRSRQRSARAPPKTARSRC
ncbi:MAG: alanine racemase [Thermoanaerobaculia bacterium]|nr:alanine racemase [Thermoanaerobaculia bacterium]